MTALNLCVPCSLLLLAFTVTVANAQGSASASPAAQAAQASPISGALDSSFAGLGIEPSNLFSFTGGSTANSLSVNLLQNLADYSGKPPHLRIGGNTGDNMIYDTSMVDFSVSKNPSSTGQGAVASDLYLFGPKYWEALDRFPINTPITFGLNMAYEAGDFKDRIVAEAEAAVKGLTNAQLVSFEIGNEPDLWLANGFRTGTWDGAEYTKEWLDRAATVWQQVLKPAGLSSAFFEPAATASTIETTFEIDLLVQDGIRNGTNGSGSFIAGWNQHDYFYFVSVTKYGLTLDNLMQLQTTETQFDYWTHQVQAAIATGLPYYLREMASAGPVGVAGISDTFGAALWTLNFFCYAASLGIASVQMHMTDNSYASPWQPIPLDSQAPYVRPSYYGFAAMAQIVGSGNGTTQIAALPLSGISSSYAPYVRAYSVYTNGALSGVVVINGMTSNSSESNKESLTVSVSFPNSQGKTLYLSSLTAAGADALDGATWNGISYSDSDGTPSTSGSVQTVQIGDDGSATFSVRDSEAIVANVDYVLGSHPVVLPSSPGARTTRKSAAVTATGGATTAVITGGITSAISLATSVGSAKATSAASPGLHAGVMGPRGSSRLGSSLMLGVMVFTALVLGVFGLWN